MMLTEEQEQDVADWYRENEVLYNKCKKGYRDNKLKMTLFEEKASSLGPRCTAQQLRTWIESMRTTVGKITRNTSDSRDDARTMTDREKWVMDSFGFLQDHIRRITVTRLSLIHI